MTCPKCGSTVLRWAAESARREMWAECQQCGTVYDAPRYGEIVDSIVYSPIQACEMCGMVHPT